MKMSVRKGVFSSFSRGAVLASVAVALAAVEPSVAMAGSATPAAKGLSADHGASGNTDISAARRRHYGRGGGAAPMAAFSRIVGPIRALAAGPERPRDYYYGGPAHYR